MTFIQWLAGSKSVFLELWAMAVTVKPKKLPFFKASMDLRTEWIGRDAERVCQYSILVFLVFTCTVHAWSGKVVGIADGDTIILLNAGFTPLCYVTRRRMKLVSVWPPDAVTSAGAATASDQFAHRRLGGYFTQNTASAEWFVTNMAVILSIPFNIMILAIQRLTPRVNRRLPKH